MRRRALTTTLPVLAVTGAGLVGYLALKRPGDVSNPGAAFEAPAKQQQKKKKRKAPRTTPWPRYGYDLERTKSLDAPRVEPPFRKVWKYTRPELIEFAPIVVKDRLYGIYNDGVFVALDAKTGKVVWKRKYGELNASSPAYAKGRLYAVTLEPGQAIALNARNGKRIWRKELPGRAESSPLVHKGVVYFGTETGDFYALNARNGKEIWRTGLDGEVKAAPAFHDGNLYVGDYAGKMHSIRARDGAVRWTTSDLGAGLGRSGRFYSTPAVAFGRVYAGNVDGRVYSFERDSGEIAWTFSAGDFVYSGIAAADRRGTKPAVYFGSHDSNVYSLDAKSGDVIWEARAGGQVSGPGTVIGDVAYASTFSGDATVGLDLKTGKRVFKVEQGQYGPAVSDGQRLFLTAGDGVIAYDPVRGKERRRLTRKENAKGILVPKRRGGKGKRGGKRGARKGSRRNGSRRST